MKKSYLLLFVAAFWLAAVHSVYAQTGCDNSPENPTAILAVVGSAGAFLVSARARYKSRRADRQSK